MQAVRSVGGPAARPGFALGLGVALTGSGRGGELLPNSYFVLVGVAAPNRNVCETVAAQSLPSPRVTEFWLLPTTTARVETSGEFSCRLPVVGARGHVSNPDGK